MIFSFIPIIFSVITPNISVDQTTIYLKGENEELTQEQFRFYANKDIILNVTLEGFNILKANALLGCPKLTIVSFRGHFLKSIESNCFKQCSSLTSIELPSSLKSINGGCFYECRSLSHVAFPSTLTIKSFISKEFLFYGCNGLQKFTVKDGNPELSTNKDGSILIGNKTIALFCVNKETIMVPTEIEEITGYFINGLNLIKNFKFEEGSKLNKIGERAFRSTNIKTMIFPPKLKVIESNPFDFTYINELFLPASLEVVPNDLFVGQPLINLTIEDGIIALNVESSGSIFNKDNTALMYIKPDTQSIEIKQNTTEIPEGLLQGIKTLSMLTVQPNHTKFYDFKNILYNSSGLVAAPGGIEHAVIDSQCTNIFQSAFSDCRKLSSIDFNGSKITRFGTSAFNSCKSLAKISLPSTLEHIGSYCFSGANLNETKVKFGPSLISIAVFAFYSTQITDVDFSECTNNIDVPINCFTFASNLIKVLLPPKCTRLLSKSFQGCSSLKSITITPEITCIDSEAFLSCSSLSEVEFEGNSLEIIQSSAFENCNISSIKIPDSVTEIQTGAFANNVGMREIEFTDKSQLRKLFPRAFAGCSEVKDMFLGENVEMISVGALSHMMSLTNIRVSTNNRNYSSVEGVLHTKDGRKLIACPGGIVSLNVSEGVTEFEKSSFLGCSKLISIQMEEEQNITKIPEQTFYGCTSLESIVIPRRVQTIEAEGFDGCVSLNMVVFRKGSELVSLGSSSFRGCDVLENVIFEEESNLETIEEGAFEGCINLKKFTFGNKVKIIQSRAFKGCPLKDIVLSNLEVIGERSFEGFKATKIILPKSLNSLGSLCFTGCCNLRKIFYCGDSNLDGNLVMNRTEINSGRVSFYVRSTYSNAFETAGGFPPLRVLDEECNAPTFDFTRGEDVGVQPITFILSSVLNGDFEYPKAEYEYMGKNLDAKNDYHDDVVYIAPLVERGKIIILYYIFSLFCVCSVFQWNQNLPNPFLRTG